MNDKKKYRVTIWIKGMPLNSESIIVSVTTNTRSKTNDGIIKNGKRKLSSIVEFDNKIHNITWCESDMLNFYRTKKAVKKYDLEDRKFHRLFDSYNGKITNKQVEKIKTQLAIVEEYGRLVGLAFGTDTISINSIQDCERYIRPGPKVAAPGAELSLVRRMLKRWDRESNWERENKYGVNKYGKKRIKREDIKNYRCRL